MSGNISADNFVKSGDITKAQFEAKLEEQQLEAAQKQKALSIFESYAKKTEGGAEDVLDVQEQQLAKAAFDALNTNKTDELTQKEFDDAKANDTDLQDADFDIYSTFANALNSVKPKEKSSIELAKEKFSTEDDVKKAVASYLLGTDVTQLHEDDSTWLKDSIPSGVEIQMPKEEKDNIKITYNGKEFIVHIVDDKVSIDSTGTENPTTLQKEILYNDDSRDVSHNYLNKHGASGNSQSKYSVESGVISNTSTKRQHVNPAQTFAAMVLNDSTESTLSFAKGLKSEDVIAVITEDKESDGITLPQLLRYLTAVDDETSKTVKAGITTGSRTAAKDLDLDEKDMANIGIVFKKFAGDDGKLDKTELQNLINALTTKGTTMTSLARGAEDKFKYQHHTPVVPEDDPAPQPKPQPQPKQDEPKVRPNRQRNIAGSNKKETVDYLYEDGMRTVVDKDGHKVTDYNIAEYEDHGLLGAGKKDFIKIQGLPPEVRAEVMSGKLNEDMVIQVKDKDGNITYNKVSYDATNGTYTLGEQITKEQAEAIKKGDKSKVQEQQEQTSPVTPKGNPDIPEIDLDIDQSKLSLPKGGEKGKLDKNGVAQYAQNDPTYIQLCKLIEQHKAEIEAVNKKYDAQVAALNEQYKINDTDDRTTQKAKTSRLNTAIRAANNNRNIEIRKIHNNLNILLRKQEQYLNTLTNWTDTTEPKLTDNGVMPAKVTLPDGTKAYRVNGEYFEMNQSGYPGEKLTPEARTKHGITDDYVKSQYTEPSHDGAGATWFEVNPRMTSYTPHGIVKYTRQNDDTIVAQYVERQQDENHRTRKYPRTIRYQSDGKTEISDQYTRKRYIGNIPRMVPTTVSYNNGKISTLTEEFNSKNTSEAMLSIVMKTRFDGTTSSEAVDKNGKTVLRYDNNTNKFYTPDGAEIDQEQAEKILGKLKGDIKIVHSAATAQSAPPQRDASQEIDYSKLTRDQWQDLANKATTETEKNDIVDKYIHYNNLEAGDRDAVMQLFGFTTPGDPKDGTVDMFELMTKYPGVDVTNNDEGGLLLTAPNGQTLEVGNTPEEYARAEEFIKANRK